MRPVRALLSVLSFLCLALTAALAVDGISMSPAAPTFVWASVLATAAAAPALFRRRVWPLALVLLPLGALLLLHAHAPAPPEADGLGGRLDFYAQQMGAGVDYFATHKAPLDLVAFAGLRLLLGLLVYCIAWVAAVVGLGLRRPVAAVVILAVPLVFGLTVDRETGTLASPVAFLLFAACLLLTPHVRRRRLWTLRDMASGLAIATVAIVFAAWVAGATSLADNPPWRDWRTWDRRHGEARFGFDSMAGLAGLLDPDNDAFVMQVVSPVATYWRANALGRFDGNGWYADSSGKDDLERDTDGRDFTYAVPPVDLVPRGRLVRQEFAIREMESDYYVAGGAVRTLVLGRTATVSTDGNAALAAEEPLPPGTRYAVTAVVPTLGPEGLIGLGRHYPEHVRPLARLPFPTPADSAATALAEDWREAMLASPQHAEWLGLYAMNRDIVGDATDPYEIALRIERHLRSHYSYSLSAPSPQQGSPYAAFLFDSRRGFCQHFAGTMAVLLRFNGIPARVAVGFATGDQAGDDRYVVTRNDAHAWVEAYFPGVGWVPFEPTADTAMPGLGVWSTSQGLNDPFLATKLDAAEMHPATLAAGAPRGLREKASPRLAPLVAQTPALSPAWPRLLSWAAMAAALAALTWPLGRALRRRRGLGAADAERRLHVSLAMVEAELKDFGIAVPPSYTLDEMGSLLTERLGVEAAPLVEQAQAVLFGGREATADDVAAVAGLRRELRRALRARYGRWRALLALYGLNRQRGGVPTASPHSLVQAACLDRSA